ncbi:MAG: hypothetical protein MRJ65_02565 [Candidatus Brocadiaceae bacterium]|nr:hypothetical protein [Candidatus Brocadiaceae bacterium]
MKTRIFLGVIFLFLIQMCCLGKAGIASGQSADENWKNFFAVKLNDSEKIHAKYAKQMGYSSIAIRDRANVASSYRNNPDLVGLKFFLSGPEYYQDYVMSGHARTIDTTKNYSWEEKNFYNRNMAWKSTDPFPHNLATGWVEGDSAKFQVRWDYQQQRVIDEIVENIILLAKSIEDKKANFTFGGYMIDVPKLAGGFTVYDPKRRSKNMIVDLSYWTGSDSCLVHDDITHEYKTYTEGFAAFYKQLNARMREEFPDAKWIIHPWKIYDKQYDFFENRKVDEWIKQIKDRPDKDELTADMMFQEKSGTDFADDENIFNSGVKITRDRVGISQPLRQEGVNDYENLLYAAKAGINGSWYNWYNRYCDDPKFSSITRLYPRFKLIRCLPNWDNLNKVPLAERSWNGNVYQSTHSYADDDVMYSRQPKTGKLFAVFMSKNGVIKLNSGETVTSMQHIDDYFIESGNASADFNIIGDEIRLRDNVRIDVDSTNGRVKGNGYIFTLSFGDLPVVMTGSAANVTSDSAILDGTVNANGLSTMAWFEYGVTSKSYDRESSKQSIGGSNNTVVSADISGLSTATKYYYRLVAQNNAGITYGSEMFFNTVDTTAPNCSISINNGDSYTTSVTVNLTLSATDSVGVTGYYLSTGSSIPLSSASGWMTVSSATDYNDNVQYTFSDGDGNKKLYAWYKDEAGNVSETASDFITLDATPPMITITSPTSSSDHTTTVSTINLGGTASDGTSGIGKVTWKNDRGGDGTASGTTTWSISDIKVSEGENVITVTAMDGAGNTTTDTINVHYSSSDTSAPMITIVSPTSSSDHTTAINTINLGGTASDGTGGIGKVTWSNDRGGDGTASGTTTWSISGINLSEGKNVITVTATDGTGNTATDTIHVYYKSESGEIKANYEFNEGSGLTATDSSGNGNDGAINGAVWSTGQSGSGLDFDGIDDSVDFSTNLGITDELTVSAWVYPTAAPDGSGRVIAATYDWDRTAESVRGWSLGIDNGSVDRILFRVHDSLGKSVSADIDNFFADNLNRWTLVTGVFKPSQYVRMYVNGTMVSEKTTGVPAAIAYADGTNLRIGMRADSSTLGMWRGGIDEVQIYDRALTDQEVLRLFNDN